jgi:hypothetical protein
MSLEVTAPAQARVAVAKHTETADVNAVGELLDDTIGDGRTINAIAAGYLIPSCARA